MDKFGDIGVSVFLLISCYYLVDFDSRDEDFSLCKYWIKKFKRLWPCYVISILLTSVIVHIFPLPERMSTWKDLLLNLFFVNGFIDTAYVDGAHWYLTTLISILLVIGIAKKLKLDKTPYFYIAWNVVYFLILKLEIPYIPTLIGGLYIGYVNIGVFLGFVLSVRGRHERSPKTWIPWLLEFAVGIVMLAYSLGKMTVLITIFAAAILTLCILEKLNIFENKFLLFIGSISYPLYLCHQNLIYEIEYHLESLIGTYSYWYGMIAIAVIIPLAVGLYYIDGIIQKELRKI